MVVLRSTTEGLTPEFEYVETSIVRARRSSPTEGGFRRRKLEELERRAWSLNWTAGNEGNKTILERAWETDTKRGVESMTYTPRGEADIDAVEVVLAGPPTIERVGANRWRMQVVLEEDIDG